MSNHHPYGPSSLDRIHKCPGSVAASDGLPEQDTEYSAEGTMLHTKVYPLDQDLSDLTDDQRDAVMVCREKIMALTVGDEESYSELRVGFTDVLGFEAYYGTADFILVGEHAVTVLDWKFGYKSVPPPSKNLQLEAYAIALAQRFERETVHAGVVCPRQHLDCMFTFSKDDLEIAEENVLNVIDYAKSHPSEFHINEHCGYCKAKFICQERNKACDDLQIAEATLELMPADVLSDHLEKALMIKSVISQIEKEARRRLEQDNESLPGWHLKESRGMRSINDVNKAYEMACDLFNEEEFRQFCKIGLTDFEKAWTVKYAEKNECKKNEAKDKFNEIMPVEYGNPKMTLTKDS